MGSPALMRQPGTMKEHAFHRLHRLRIENDEAAERTEEMRPRFEALKTRHEDGTAPQAVSAFNLFQTPETLAGELVEAAQPRKGLRWLEPSAGLGRLLRPIFGTSPGEVVAIEQSEECCGQLYREFQDLRLCQGDFLSRDDLGTFDRVAMNPPFKMRRDIKHINHALTMLAPGGVLSALCLDTHHRETAFRERASTWRKIPAGTFRKEGTGVATVLFTIKG